jgi:hypothetical protein
MANRTIEVAQWGQRLRRIDDPAAVSRQFLQAKAPHAKTSVGGVERSTSSTNPGRGISVISLRCSVGALTGDARAQIEGDFHSAATTGRRSMFDRIVMIDERIRGRQQIVRP